MILRLRALLLLCFCCCLAAVLSAQTNDSCYESVLQQGLAAQKAEDYDLAIKKFNAAKFCPDKPQDTRIDSLLKQAQQARIEALTVAREKAEYQLTISESIRLAFHSKQELEKGNTKLALKLAFRSMKSIKEHNSREVQLSYGDAVYFHTLIKLAGHEQNILYAEFSKDGDQFLTFSKNRIIVWTSSGEQLAVLNTNGANIHSAHFSLDGKHIVVANGKKVDLWKWKENTIHILSKHNDLVFEAVFSNDGLWVASCSRDQTIQIWDWKKARLKTYCQEIPAPVTNLQFSKDDTKILGVSSDKKVRIWNINGTLKQEIEHNGQYFSQAVFGPLKDQLLTATTDHTMQIWQLGKQKPVSEFKGHEGMIRHFALSPDQTSFFSGGIDHSCVLWVAPGKEIFRLIDHKSSVNIVNYSPDGEYLLTGADDGTAKLYSKNGQLLMNLAGAKGGIQNIVLSRDNRHIVLVGDDESVYLCQNPITYFPLLENDPPPDFTPEEKEKYLLLENETN